MYIAFIEGLIWSLLWIIYVYVIVTRYPWQMLHDYPQDIQKTAKIPLPTRQQNKSAKLFGLIGSLIIFSALIIFGLLQFSKAQTSFVQVFLFVFVIAMIWNIIDLLVMDWLIICKITPNWVVLEGTEGCKGYKDYFYHFKGFLIGCVYSAIMSIIITGIDYFILKFLIWRV